jgi:hypothetical protein
MRLPGCGLQGGKGLVLEGWWSTKLGCPTGLSSAVNRAIIAPPHQPAASSTCSAIVSGIAPSPHPCPCPTLQAKPKPSYGELHDQRTPAWHPDTEHALSKGLEQPSNSKPCTHQSRGLSAFLPRKVPMKDMRGPYKGRGMGTSPVPCSIGHASAHSVGCGGHRQHPALHGQPPRLAAGCLAGLAPPHRSAAPGPALMLGLTHTQAQGGGTPGGAIERPRPSSFLRTPLDPDHFGSSSPRFLQGVYNVNPTR